MSVRNRRSTFRILLGLAALCGLVLFAAVVLMHRGVLPLTPSRVAGLTLGILGLGLAVLEISHAISARRSRSAELDPASELSTLTFPPTSLREAASCPRGK